MYSVQQLLALYEQRFGVNSFGGSPSQLYSAVNHIMNMKGKRMRPLLLLLACDMFGGDVENALNPAFAMELFHNFTLVHDDIMDNADIRRGRPTVHKLYGLNAGILAGDAMLSYAYKYLIDVKTSSVSSLMKIFNDTAIEIFEGQQMDMDFEVRNEVLEAEYLKMIEYKTSVLLGCCLQLGAILAGAEIANQKLVYEFGKELGLSFQIMDDYLDAFGEEQKVGKKIGGDILRNKKTYLFVQAWLNADDKQKSGLHDLLREKDDDYKIKGVKKIMKATGADEKALKKAGELYKNACHCLEKITVQDSAKTELFLLAQKLNQREF